jgi:hypothetical protein
MCFRCERVTEPTMLDEATLVGLVDTVMVGPLLGENVGHVLGDPLWPYMLARDWGASAVHADSTATP